MATGIFPPMPLSYATPCIAGSMPIGKRRRARQYKCLCVRAVCLLTWPRFCEYIGVVRRYWYQFLRSPCLCPGLQQRVGLGQQPTWAVPSTKLALDGKISEGFLARFLEGAW